MTDGQELQDQKEEAEFRRLAGVEEDTKPEAEKPTAEPTKEKALVGTVLTKRQRSAAEHLFGKDFDEEAIAQYVESGVLQKVAGLRTGLSRLEAEKLALEKQLQAKSEATPDEDEFGFETDEPDEDSGLKKEIAELKAQIATLSEQRNQSAAVGGSVRSFFDELADKGITAYGRGDTLTEDQQEARQEIVAMATKLKSLVPDEDVDEKVLLAQALQLKEPDVYEATRTKQILDSQLPTDTSVVVEKPADTDDEQSQFMALVERANL